MAALIPFTSNYTDVSRYEGYQFEFHCQRCGNGYRSAFRHSVTGSAVPPREVGRLDTAGPPFGRRVPHLDTASLTFQVATSDVGAGVRGPR